MKKAAVYIRVSTEEQAKEGYSISAQQEKLKAFCLSKDWQIQDIYIDEGYSGKNLNRPALKRLLSHINNFDLVLVYKLDRLSRSQKDVLHLIEDIFEPNQVGFVSTLENFDTTLSFGKAMLGIIAVFAQLERESITERARLGKREQARQGKWRGGPVPLGYDYIDQQLVINEYEALIIRKIFQYYLDGMGMNAIANRLNRQGYKSKQNRPFSPSKIRTYLTNPLYAGMMPYKNQVFQGVHPKIIEKDLFSSAQAIIAERGQNWRKPSSSLLGGILCCGECGAKVFERKMQGTRYYTCYTYHGSPDHMRTAPHCSLGYKNSKDLEEYILAQLKYQKEDYAALDREIERYLKDISTRDFEGDIEVLKKELVQVDHERLRWYDAYGKGSFSLDEIEKRIEAVTHRENELQKQIAIIENQSKTVRAKSVTMEMLKKNAYDFHQIWKFATCQERRKITTGFLRSVSLYKKMPPQLTLRE
ncbi:recombinase family protein [Geosporobacter ferrireducens]|uniref:Integrase n=1 Tax=Geosporobacter ferrireducens TaxID=1424294 RepID=A0A1D8GDD5_9FIRM|nr:recombinase family protein [Geosporobacter ferrireducens]AOT68919.1 hypothetical protein Gferi_04730 [Geosporobacter ferrireducens]